MLKVKNPWAWQPWIGRFSSEDKQHWTTGLKQALGVTDEILQSLGTLGVFWMEFRDTRQFFKSYRLSCKYVVVYWCWDVGGSL